MLLVNVSHELSDVCLFRVFWPPERRFSLVGHDRILIKRSFNQCFMDKVKGREGRCGSSL